LARSLVDHGLISEKSFEDAIPLLGVPSQPFDNIDIELGSTILFHADTLNLFSELGLLRHIATHYKVYITPEQHKDATKQVERDHNITTLKKWVATFIERIRHGIELGVYELVQNTQPEIPNHPDTNV